MWWPLWELVASSVEKTQRSALPVSKSRSRVCPPTTVDTRYSTPFDGIAVAEPSWRLARALRKDAGISRVGVNRCLA